MKAIDETAYVNAKMLSSDSPNVSADYLPTGLVFYRSTKGLEGYYSYHEQDLGRTGKGFVNRYNGNLVFVHENEGTSGNLMPISHSLVYNLSDCDTDSRFGKGWRSSLQEKLVSTGITDNPYVLTDADGTNHYFYTDTNDSNKIKDEDGLGFVITQTTGTSDAYMIMENKG